MAVYAAAVPPLACEPLDWPFGTVFRQRFSDEQAMSLSSDTTGAQTVPGAKWRQTLFLLLASKETIKGKGCGGEAPDLRCRECALAQRMHEVAEQQSW